MLIDYYNIILMNLLARTYFNLSEVDFLAAMAGLYQGFQSEQLEQL